MKPIVEKVGIANTEADADLFAHYCQLTVQYHKALEAVRDNGLVLAVKTKNGEGYCQNPASRALIEYGRQIDGLRQQLGLSPPSRARFKIHAEPLDEREAAKDRFLDGDDSALSKYQAWHRRTKDAG